MPNTKPILVESSLPKTTSSQSYGRENPRSIADSSIHYDYVPVVVRSDVTEETTEAPTELDVWDMGWEWYGIDYLTTTRMLKLITLEGYADDWMLDYYCALACVTRALYPQDFMGSNIYERVGEMDDSYGLWIDDIGIADHSIEALESAYKDFHYINQCNGMATPENYIYYSEIYGIYVWN